MGTLFEDRERAAEYGFAHGEELRLLADRAGVEALGLWAAERTGAADPDAYAATLVGARVAGADDATLLRRVHADLARAGAPEAAQEAGRVLTRATAEATLDLHGTRVVLPSPVAAAMPPASEHERNAFWGW